MVNKMNGEQVEIPPIGSPLAHEGCWGDDVFKFGKWSGVRRLSLAGRVAEAVSEFSP